MNLQSELLVIAAGAQMEWRQVRRAPLFLVLVISHALLLLLLIMLFGLSGSRAPVAVVMTDMSAPAREFLQALESCHHSFAVRRLDAQAAQRQLLQGRISAVITIPPDFSARIAQWQPVAIRVDIDNVNADLSEDIRRALPAAIVAFGQGRDRSQLHLHLLEHDRLDHDTDFIPYLAASALALDALAISSVLAALALIRDRESGMITSWNLAPRHPGVLLSGRVCMTALLSAGALLVPVVVVISLGVIPRHVAGLILTLGLLVSCGSCVGVAVGTLIASSGTAIAIILGCSLAVYLGSGAIEPQRFDGELIWYLAHVTPAYSAVALVEDAIHGVVITPEPMVVNVLVVGCWMAVALVIARWRFPRRLPA